MRDNYKTYKRQHEINNGIPSKVLFDTKPAIDKANIYSPKHYSWTPSEKEVPNDNRTVFIVKDRCHFIGFYEGKKFWLSSQNGVPINKRLKRTEIKQPLHWIDYPEDNSP